MSVCDELLKKCFYIVSGESCEEQNLTLVGLHSKEESDALNLIIRSFRPLQDIVHSSGLFIGRQTHCSRITKTCPYSIQILRVVKNEHCKK